MPNNSGAVDSRTVASETADSGLVERQGVDVTSPVADVWPALPTETEIYLLPDGRVVIADLPMELADLVAQLGVIAEVAPTDPTAPVAYELP